MGASGTDILVSPTAQEHFPFDVECKNQEKLNIWEALEQADRRLIAEDPVPLLVFKRNQSDTYVALTWSDFIALVRRGTRE